MLKNHILIAFRNFKKRKAFTFINILGLTVGMTVCLLILTYAKYEMSYDRFHTKAEDIYRVTVDIYNGNTFQIADAQCYPGAGLIAKEQLPEVTDYAMARNFGRLVFKRENTSFNEDRAYFANPAWLKVFDWEMVKGDPETALSEVNQIVLTEGAAKKYFGEEDPMGKTLTVIPGGGAVDMQVSGVIKDVPANTHLTFDILVSYESAISYLGSTYEDFGGNNEFMYLLTNQADQSVLEKKLNEIYFKHTESFEERGDSLVVQPLADIHLHSDKTFEAQANGSAEVVNILIIVAVFVLVIAWVNYINLSTARAMERAKEVGLKKVMGSGRGALIAQFLTESFVLNLLAVVLTITLIQGVLPSFNRVAGVTLSFNLLDEPSLIWQILLIYAIGAIASGVYPAFVLSGHKPLAVISGKLKDSKSGLFLRKGLVVFQFAITMLLLVGTLTIYKQVNHMRNQDLGVNLAESLAINNPLLPEDEETIAAKRKTLRSELLRLSQVESVALSESSFGRGTLDLNTTTGMYTVGTEAGKNVNFAFFRVDDQLLQSFEIELLAGRYFNAELETPFEDTDKQYHGMIVNETGRKTLGFDSNEAAIGQKVNRWGRIFTLVGVIGDYNQNSVKYNVEPMAFFFDKASNYANYTLIKLKADDQNGYAASLSAIRELYQSVYPASDFEYFFVDEDFNKQYRADQQFGTVFTSFAIMTIFVAILGLFGLVLYEVQQRIKEIGIRKVLGASVPSIIKLFSTNFLKLIGVSIIIAIPVAYFVLNQWLLGYANRISIGWVLFVVPAAVLLLIALLTIISQSIKAANGNPAKALRYE
ncbi:putative ABC transport system permease protein [Roseivirga pacifica]|uniref:Putative ABC transport system permease protein n=1 Tax=Roseivirga pacifica TaxID=1267423 RepID=A0A1I0RSN5_9BACT|nr:ABC transporter permease [Roseivirga pacifica]RKQ49488.1 putative ABC transport system permease protein [Roseivirga pacifica]SEW44328.1 putative ABC transport system permease protein [Roseivirga pacifica]